MHTHTLTYDVERICNVLESAEIDTHVDKLSEFSHNVHECQDDDDDFQNKAASASRSSAVWIDVHAVSVCMYVCIHYMCLQQQRGMSSRPCCVCVCVCMYICMYVDESHNDEDDFKNKAASAS